MQRRTFVKTTVAAGLSAAFPGWQRVTAAATSSGSTLIVAASSDGSETTIDAADISDLARRMRGALFLPADDGYDAVRQVWNAMIDKRPALIARCADVSDVQACVGFARDRRLLLAIRCGGHSYPGKSTCDGGMVIDLSPMRAVSIDKGARTATAQGGALLAHLDQASLAEGLVTTAGIVSHTGVGGFTLGGGMGRLDRKYGLTIDNLLSADVVTADGQLRHASEDENPDLFWALRGGGGNFGVVTTFVYRLHPFDDTVYAGFVEYPFDKAKQVLRQFAEFERTLPDAANVEPYLYLDEGTPTVGFSVLYAGSPKDGEKVCRPLLAFSRPSYSSLDADRYSSWQTMLDADLGHGKLNYLKSGYIVELTPDLIDALVDNFEGSPYPNVWFQHLGGTSSRVADDATAYPHRDVRFNLGVDAVFTDPSETEARVAAVRRYYAAMEPFMKGFYTNLNEASVEKTWGNYGSNYPRLSEIKKTYDPGNLFRLNSNIEPAA
jgi:FAD/FMN-containing dehydrogenase